VQFSYDATAITGAAGNAGAVYIPTIGKFWTSKWASAVADQWNPDGTLDVTFNLPFTGTRGMCFDGQYVYCSNATTTVNIVDPVTKLVVGTVPVVGAPNGFRSITYNPDGDGGAGSIIGGNWTSPNLNFYEFSLTGTLLRTITNAVTGVYGLAYDNYSPGGPFLWVWGQGAGAGTPQIIQQMDWTTGTYTGITHDVTTDVGLGNASAIAGGMFITDQLVPGYVTLGGMLQGVPDVLFGYELTPAGGPTVITIAEAIEDLNMDFIPDRLGQTVTVEGVVFSPNFQSANNEYFISDGTAGTDIFMYGPPVLTWNFGDMLQITGEVSQYNGKTEIIPADSSGWVFQSAGNPTPNPIVITLAQYKANSEMYEGSLVGFASLTLVSGTWPAAGSSANLSFSDGMDTVVFRIDSDTDIDGQPEPTWPRDILGIGSQFDSSTPPDGGYQIFPRYYATDFLPPGTIPVELTSFTASVNPGSVTLSWSTATETNNQGFEIQRNNGSEFYAIGFVTGNGTTTEINNYSYTDRNLTAGNYSYRLKQVDFNGRYEYSNVINVDVAPEQFELSQNYPNPFNPSTTINFSIPQSSIVTLKVFNTLGQEVKTLVNQNMESGVHSISFDASELNSGIYFYRLDAGQFTEVRKMTLIK